MIYIENTFEKLSDCELQIMSILWSNKEDITLADIEKAAASRFGKEWKLQTIATFMTRLSKKKFVDIYRIERYSHYKYLISKDEYCDYLIKDTCNLLYDTSIEEFVLHAVGAIKNPEKLRELAYQVQKIADSYSK